MKTEDMRYKDADVCSYVYQKAKGYNAMGEENEWEMELAKCCCGEWGLVFSCVCISKGPNETHRLGC